MGSKTQRTVPYKDADEAFEAWWDSLPDAQRKYWRHCAAAVQKGYLEGWAAHADHVRETATPRKS